MSPKLFLKWIGMFFGLSALLFVQSTQLFAQPIPPEHTPSQGASPIS
jgi:hypothetical protein